MTFTPFDYSLLEQCQDKRILCLGDCMLDKFVYGKVDRLSPEAPVPVFQETNETLTLGGAANVAANISTYGCNVEFISVIGNDPDGTLLTQTIKNHPHIIPHLFKEESRSTTMKTRYVTHSQHLLRVDKEEQTPISPTTQQQIIATYTKLIDTCDIVLLSDYSKGFFTPKLTQELIKIARHANKTIIVDPKGSDYSKYQDAVIITPNRAELKAATGLRVATDEDVVIAARQLIDTYNIETVLVTRSEEGMSLINAQEAYHISTEAKQVYDVSGAGDTCVATLSLALSCGIELQDACEVANIAAGIAVGKSGTALVYLEELLYHLLRKYKSHLPEKLISLPEAEKIVKRWKAAGKKIGFTNGCFDLVHPGHTTLIKEAKQLCDILIIGLNSDHSVKSLKGEQRPVQNEQARAMVLSSLVHTDLVIIFEELTPLKLIETLQPDVLIKGSDYTIDQVVGGDIVTSYGGKVVLVNLVPNFSTTNIIKKLNS